MDNRNSVICVGKAASYPVSGNGCTQFFAGERIGFAKLESSTLGSCNFMSQDHFNSNSLLMWPPGCFQSAGSQYTMNIFLFSPG